MSLATWKEEFYPIPAEDACRSVMEALDHSILKWSGVTKENLIKHGCELYGCEVQEISDIFDFRFNSSTCALCKLVEEECCDCIITKACGCPCCSYRNYTEPTAYGVFIHKGDGEPMRKLLVESKKYLDKEGTYE